VAADVHRQGGSKLKQVTHTQRNGDVRVLEVPVPALRPNGLLIRTAFSIISAGTERAKVEVAKKSLLGKALARPDQVRLLVESARQLGLAATYEKVKTKMDAFSPLGYSMAGVVIGVGASVTGFKAGDRVACGGETASHAEVVAVPQNLCVHVPDAVPLDQAAFATIGAIALQGVRQAGVSLGETVGVVGLGLLGLITVQLLRSAGCRVVGVDLDASRRALAERFGADATFAPDNPDAERFTRRVNAAGLDAVIIAAATTTNAPIELAGRLSRDRGRVVIVGAVRIDIPRSPFYEKELEVRLSRSYGPGRYDPQYEEKGTDYPIGYVRWTEGRNMGAVLDLVAQGKLDVSSLITHRYLLSEAERAYQALERGGEPSLGVVLDHEFLSENDLAAKKTVSVAAPREPKADVGVAFIGAGNFSQAMLLPHLKNNRDVRLCSVATRVGLNARSVAERADFENCSTDIEAVLADPAVDLVLIASRHDSHAELVAASIAAGKAVFVEKPLAITPAQLTDVIAAHARSASEPDDRVAGRQPFVMVGFNRRFQPLVGQLRKFVHESREPLLVHYRVNAGYIPRDHWTQDREQGGGRIIGEVCHFVDLVLHLIDDVPVEVHAHVLPDLGRYSRDNVAVMIRFQNGSAATIAYAANGDRGLEKERVEVFGGGRGAVLDDFRRLTLTVGGSRTTVKSGPDKGHRGEMQALIEAVKAQEAPPIPFDEAVRTMTVTFAIEESLASGVPVPIA
jgi:predicted dehydrogenase